MKPTDEQISAWLDGALPDPEALALEAALERDAGLAERVARLESNDDLLRTALPLDENVPQELLARLGLAEEPVPRVVDIASARQKRAARATGGWGWTLGMRSAGWRIAAQVLVVVGLGSTVVHWSNVRGPDEAPYRTLGDPVKPAPGNAIIMFRSDIDDRQARDLIASMGSKVVGNPTAAGAYRVLIAANQRDAVLTRLRALPEVQLAEPVGEGL